MGRFLSAAFEVLKNSDVPLGPSEIVERAMTLGILWTSGLTPSQTMKSKISTDILQKKESSLFMRAEKGKFTLRPKNQSDDEYIANRFIKKPLSEQILVIPRRQFKKIIPKVGLTKDTLALQRLLLNASSFDRMSAELDKRLIQLVSFFLVSSGDKLVSYKRTARLPEKSLKGIYSLGFGGHMTMDDIDPLFILTSPLEAIMPAVRELNEELKLPSFTSPEFIGLVYDNSNPTSRLHVGLVFEVFTQSHSIESGEKGNFTDIKLESRDSIKNRLNDFESWSRMLINRKNRRE
jgi:predicted NUDIX family phosphoesterase